MSTYFPFWAFPRPDRYRWTDYSALDVWLVVHHGRDIQRLTAVDTATGKPMPVSWPRAHRGEALEPYIRRVLDGLSRKRRTVRLPDRLLGGVLAICTAPGGERAPVAWGPDHLAATMAVTRTGWHRDGAAMHSLSLIPLGVDAASEVEEYLAVFGSFPGPEQVSARGGYHE